MPQMDFESDIADEIVRYFDKNSIKFDRERSTDASYHEFQHYFEGVDAGAALTLAHPQPFSRKIPLEDLRATPRGFRPPQSFAYVDAETGSRLMGLAA